MNRRRIFITVLIFNIFVIVHNGFSQVNSSCLLKSYCGADVLGRIFKNFGVPGNVMDKQLSGLNALADENKGFNTLYEIKIASQKAGLKVGAFRIKSDSDIKNLRLLLDKGLLIANITGNRHFCLVKGIDEHGVHVYIPGLNYPDVQLSHKQFLEYWDRVALLVSKKNINIRNGKEKFIFVLDDELKEILGGNACGNSCGSAVTATGSQGVVKATEGNSSPRNFAPSAGARNEQTTADPVVVRNGNLFLNVGDISVPARGIPLNLTRYYNAEVVSEVFGWLPEPGAGSWAVEKGEYSGQGDRSTTEAKFADLVLELDMQVIKPGTNYSWETAWVNIRYTARADDPRKPKDCYYFLMHTDGKIELAKWQNGAQYFLYNKYTSYSPLNKNRIRVEAIGSNIKVYINGNLEINYTDPNPLLAEGNVALESYFSHVHYDNVSIASGTKNYNYDFNQDDNEFIFGYGWTHSYFLKVKEYPNHVTLFRENNSKEIYVPQGDGTYKYIFGENYSRLAKDASGFSLKAKHGMHYRFDLSGKLVYIEDKNLNRTTFSYSDVGGKTLLTLITEPTGRSIALQYGANNMVSSATDPAGNSMQYFYDADNHLTSVVDRNGNIVKYAYDPVTHNLTQLTDSEGNVYHYTYLYNDRVNYQIDPLGNTASFDYLWSTVHVVNKRGHIYKYNFDSNGFLQSVTDPLNVMESSLNDANGNVITHYDKLGHRTNFAYDVNGNLLSVQDAQGNFSRFTYDLTYNQPLTATDAKGSITAFVYDPKGNPVQIINADGGVTTYSYNSYGQVVMATDPKGNSTTFSHDSYGNLTAKTDCLGNITSYVYDILGRIIKVVDPLGNYEEVAYDNNGNPLVSKDKLGNATVYTYTPNGKLASVTDPLLNKTVYSYDCFGNVLSVIDAQGGVTSYAYDTANQLHFDTANLLSVSDAMTTTTTYNYDSLDRLIKITDSQDKTYQFSYDAQGNLVSRTDAKSTTTTYQYDILNRLYRINYPDLTNVNYSFDSIGNITNMQDFTGTTTYAYDKLNRLKTLAYPDAVTLSYGYDLNGNKASLDIAGFGRISYEYDKLNRLAKITSPDGKATQFSYDKLSRRTQLAFPNGAMANYTYDNASRLTELINKDKNASAISKFIYTYDNLSRKTSATLLGGSINYTYDTLSRLLSESGNIGGAPFYTGYTYDKVGNRLTSTEDGALSSGVYNSLNQIVQSRTGAPKLIQVKGTVTEASPVTVRVNGFLAKVEGNQFSLDNFSLAQGSNIIKAKAVDSSGNTSSNEITVNYNSTNPVTRYSYDANGNMISRESQAGFETFVYDCENRLTGYFGPGQGVTYIYNGQGQRIRKIVNSVATQYYYDGPELILEKTGVSSIYYIHSNHLDETISDSRGYCYHSDGLGSIINLTDSSGLKANDYSYKAFGQIKSQIGAVANTQNYTGRQYDPETGLYYYRNRYYDSKIGRFITRDPIGFKGGINLYAYVQNNPVNWVDPWGLEAGDGYAYYDNGKIQSIIGSVTKDSANGHSSYGHVAIEISGNRLLTAAPGRGVYIESMETLRSATFDVYRPSSPVNIKVLDSFARTVSDLHVNSEGYDYSALFGFNFPHPLITSEYLCTSLVANALYLSGVDLGAMGIQITPNALVNNSEFKRMSANQSK